MLTSTRTHAHLSKSDQDRLEQCLEYGRVHLSDLQRRSGQSYAEHGQEVTATLAEASDDVEMLCVAMLHDILLHPNGEQLLADAPLSADQRLLIEKMHALRRLHIDENTKELDVVIDAFLDDPELLPLRMAHRLTDMRHLDRFDRLLQKQIAHETLHMYSAIAGRLGMNAWREEMEDIAFPVVRPKMAKKLLQKFADCEELDRISLERTALFLEEKLGEIHHLRIKRRRKGLYSSYRKMILKNRSFEELTDRLALRILVSDTMDCYRVLGIIHAHLHPIPGKLKDYIGAPKENGYRSIHTVVYPLPGVTEQPIEIQIRTEQMHAVCAYGAAAHGQYKTSMYALSSRPARVNLFRNLQTLRQQSRSPAQFEKALRNYFNEDHVAIFDTENNLYHMKKPATALDFVCHAFPKKCFRLKSVKINGRKKALQTVLHDGDTVEPFFGRTVTSQKDWIHACMHDASQKIIRSSFRDDTKNEKSHHSLEKQ